MKKTDKVQNKITFIFDCIITLFTPIILALFIYYIPFSKGGYRTGILRLAQQVEFKFILLLIMSALFWKGISVLLSFLTQYEIKVKRPEFLIRIVTLIFFIQAGYILFYA